MSKRHSGWWHERIEFTEGSGLEASQTPKPVLRTSVLWGPTGMPQQPWSPRLTPRQGQLSLPQLLKAAPCPCARRGTSDPVCLLVSRREPQSLPAALQCSAAWEAWGRPGAALVTHTFPASLSVPPRQAHRPVGVLSSQLSSWSYLHPFSRSELCSPLASPVITCLE